MEQPPRADKSLTPELSSEDGKTTRVRLRRWFRSVAVQTPEGNTARQQPVVCSNFSGLLFRLSAKMIEIKNARVHPSLTPLDLDQDALEKRVGEHEWHLSGVMRWRAEFATCTGK